MKYLLLFVFLLLGYIANAQVFTQEDLFIYEEDDTLNIDSVFDPSLENYIPDDIIFVPSEYLYEKKWDTLNVSANRFDLPDTVWCILKNKNETPFVMPVMGKLLSPFGYRGRHFHAGVDIKLEKGDPVVSAFDGVVRMARRYSGYGNTVVIRHNNGIETLYGHLSSIKVRPNQEVKAGDIIGKGGRTGRATCNHLHFETRILGEAFNPQRIIDVEAGALKVDTFCFADKAAYRKRHASSRPKSERVSSFEKIEEGIHIVRQGDTLYAIALKYDTSVKSICKLNKIKENKILKLGTKLKLK